ncbi:sulfatase [Isoptericola sp. NPDC019482]|uniref:sulfatase n=1 Tax=Isoptericola sp. NPDC019482 TaxID=3154688 RepID=UPI00346B2EBD
MRAIIVMFDSLNRHMLGPYADTFVDAPNFARLARKAVTFDNFYAGSMPCMPARREMHTGRYNFLHRSWGPLEPFDDSMPQMLRDSGVHTHLTSDHPHYWEDGGATYHTRYTTWEFFRGQEGDPWKGVVDGSGRTAPESRMRSQDEVNRGYMPTEAEHSQTRTFDAGLHFLETNADADRWLLQIETFDPHEPFFTHQKYKDLYPHRYEGPRFDWPEYKKVTEPAGQVDHARREYAALVSMCDRSLGRVLDAMDAHELWDDTMLVVNTDHGFLLGEHGWWAKSEQPWFNELVHLPMYLWDPRTGGRDTRRGALAQTIDIAPTVLRYFGVEPTADMQGSDLSVVLEDDREVRDAALFGIHGRHVNVTDGRYVYMRAAETEANAPLEDYTLMPTHMRSRFSVDELTGWEQAPPFSFTKGLSTMRVPVAGRGLRPFAHGTLLFDLEADPAQEHLLVDDDVELRMARLLVDRMRASDAPASQYARLGLPAAGAVGPEHLHVRLHADRARALAEPLPSVDELARPDLLGRPLPELLQSPTLRAAVERHAPELTTTETIALPASTSLLDLAAHARMPAATLRALDAELARATHDATAASRD